MLESHASVIEMCGSPLCTVGLCWPRLPNLGVNRPWPWDNQQRLIKKAAIDTPKESVDLSIDITIDWHVGGTERDCASDYGAMVGS